MYSIIVDRQSRSGAAVPAHLSGQISSRDQYERPCEKQGLSGRLTCMVISTVKCARYVSCREGARDVGG